MGNIHFPVRLPCTWAMHAPLPKCPQAKCLRSRKHSTYTWVPKGYGQGCYLAWVTGGTSRRFRQWEGNEVQGSCSECSPFPTTTPLPPPASAAPPDKVRSLCQDVPLPTLPLVSRTCSLTLPYNPTKVTTSGCHRPLLAFPKSCLQLYKSPLIKLFSTNPVKCTFCYLI